MEKNRNKVISGRNVLPVFIPWPPQKHKVKLSRQRMITPFELAEKHHEEVVRLFPKYQGLLVEMIKHLPCKTVLLFLGVNDVPNFIKILFE
jgi:hypothetical protein